MYGLGFGFWIWVSNFGLRVFGFGIWGLGSGVWWGLEFGAAAGDAVFVVNRLNLRILVYLVIYGSE